MGLAARKLEEDTEVSEEASNTRVSMPRKLSFLLQKKQRYKIAYGGRGSAKSWTFARALLILAANKCVRILCARELQNSIKDSVYKLLCDQIVDMELEDYYDVGAGYIRSACGSEFIFKGLRTNAQEIKSMEKIDICWVEEAQSVSEASWELLIPTIRAPGSEIWITFNPDLEDDPVYTRFIKRKRPNAIVVKINYWDNKWFPDVLREEMEYDKKNDYEAYLHVWEGYCRSASDAQILRGKWKVDLFTMPKGIIPLYGADWGFSTDPTALTRSFIHEDTLFVDYEAWGLRVELDKTAALFDLVPGARNYVIRADNARPETISYMKRHGYPKIQGVKKWPGSVEDGIEYMRSYKQIVIHERCRHTAMEAKLYSFKVDKRTGDVLPDVEDKNNHCMDSIRYAHQPLIRQKGVRLA